MKKKLISLLTAFSMTIMLFTGVPISISAETLTGNCGATGNESNVRWSLNTDSGLLTISGTGNMNKWDNIPDVPWDSSKDTITNIVIENGVTSIGSDAFCNCSNLTSVTIPNSVTSIGFNAFGRCSNLETINIPNGVTLIDTSAFVSCTKLTSVTLPESVTSIGTSAFAYCSNLKTVFCPEACQTSSFIFYSSPATLIRYNVNGSNEVTISKITNTSGKDISETIDIPPTIGGKPVVAIAESYQGNVGNHTHTGGTATCTEKAECTICGEEYGNLAAHNYSTTWTTSTTQHWHKCTNTGCTSTSNTANHDWNSGTVTKAATCTATGTKKFTCSTCSDTKNETIAIDSSAHKWGNWTVTKDPSLTTAGTAKRTCANNSSHIDTKDVPALIAANGWTKSETTKPTIDTDGSYTYTSTEYGDITVTIPNLKDSSWTKEETKKPTIDTDGSYTYTSEDYGTVSVTVPNLTDSKWTKNATKEPTVKEDGEYTYESEYGEIKVTVPKLTDTSVWEKTVTTKPTIDTDGSYTYTSDYDTITVTVPNLTDPAWKKDTAQHVDPTEEDPGKDVYTSEYGEVEVELPAKEHTHKYSEEWSKDETHHWHSANCVHTNETKDKAMHTGGTATCSAKAICEVCGNEYGELDSDNHNFVDGKCDDCEAVDPTHTHRGGTATCSAKAVCEVCKNEYGEFNSENHNFVDDKCEDCQTVDPNHTHRGGTATCSAKAICEICGNEYGELDSENHNFVDDKCEDCQTVDPNHTHKGGTATCSAKAVCEICENEYGELDSDNHNFVDGKCDDCEAVDPTHTHRGGTATCSAKAICEVCGNEYGELDSENHNFVDGKCDDCEAVDPNHTHKGGTATCEKKAVCEICEQEYGDLTEHNFVNGTCSVCDEADPNYVPPHNHTFVDGVCECGETDPTYVPPHEHNFVDGTCSDCGETDPTYNPSGNVTEDVNDTAGTNAEFDTPIENVLDPEDIAAIENGHSFEIVLEVTDIRNSVSSADVTAASSALKSDEEIGVYVDLSLFKIKDGTERTPIHNANGQIGITLTIPESIFAGNRTYSIIRVHNGTAENIGGTYDKANRKLTFYTDKFSTYAIAFTASSVNIDSPTIPSTPSNPTAPTTPSAPSRPSIPSTPTTGGTTPVSPSAPVVTPTVTETAAKEDEIIYDDEPYMEDVSSGAGIYENDKADKNIQCILIVIFAAIAGISIIAARKRFSKKKG